MNFIYFYDWGNVISLTRIGPFKTNMTSTAIDNKYESVISLINWPVKRVQFRWQLFFIHFYFCLQLQLSKTHIDTNSLNFSPFQIPELSLLRPCVYLWQIFSSSHLSLSSHNHFSNAFIFTHPDNRTYPPQFHFLYNSVISRSILLNSMPFPLIFFSPTCFLHILHGTMDFNFCLSLPFY